MYQRSRYLRTDASGGHLLRGPVLFMIRLHSFICPHEDEAILPATATSKPPNPRVNMPSEHGHHFQRVIAGNILPDKESKIPRLSRKLHKPKDLEGLKPCIVRECKKIDTSGNSVA